MGKRSRPNSQRAKSPQLLVAMRRRTGQNVAMADSSDLRYLLIPGGGGSGADHWHHRWATSLPNCSWVDQADPNGGTRAEWVATINNAVTASSTPAVLVAHSLACIAVAHLAAAHDGPVAAALLVAPADIDGDWAKPDSLYKRFQPIPMHPFPFPTTVVASTNDPFLALDRARSLATAWGAELEIAGDHLHLGSDALLDTWLAGQVHLEELTGRVGGS